MYTPSLTLALETSSRLGSIALGQDGRVLAAQAFSGPLRHSTEILPTLAKLLRDIARKPIDIKRVFLSIGPGSFTGLRIAVTMAKTLFLTNHVQIVPVSSLDVVAANVTTRPCRTAYLLSPIVDAKRNQFFTAVYRHDSTSPVAPQKILADCLLRADELLDYCAAQDLPLYLLGDGLLYHQEKFSGANTHVLDTSLWPPRAEQVYLLGEKLARSENYADPLTLNPFYLREALVTVKKK